MALWLVRAGKYGEFEKKFFEDACVYLTWEELGSDLAATTDYEAVKEVVRAAFPDIPRGRLGNWAGQIWAFVLGIKPGDWIVTPLKTTPAIAIGEVTGRYKFSSKAEPLFRHSRSVKWLKQDVPRSTFDQDLLYSFGAFLTVCEIKRNDAEKRVRALASAGWKGTRPKAAATPEELAAAEEEADLEQLGRDLIQKLIVRRFKGHGMERLVAAVLEAQGYKTLVGDLGPDGGKDILAAPGRLGFDRPRICVQVKSQESPVERTVLDQLQGVMTNVGADQGLLVAWGGFKSSVTKVASSKFFSVRLWNANDLVDEILAHYSQLPADIQAELPLKRIWTVAMETDA